MRILRLPEVQKVTGLSRSSIYRQVAAEQFPAPVRLSSNSIGWRDTDIDDWISARPAAVGSSNVKGGA